MTRLPFELFLGLRYLKPKRTFVSVITLISLSGVAIGVWVLIVVIAVMSGFEPRICAINSGHARARDRDQWRLDRAQ